MIEGKLHHIIHLNMEVLIQEKLLLKQIGKLIGLFQRRHGYIRLISWLFCLMMKDKY